MQNIPLFSSAQSLFNFAGGLLFSCQARWEMDCESRESH